MCNTRQLLLAVRHILPLISTAALVATYDDEHPRNGLGPDLTFTPLLFLSRMSPRGKLEPYRGRLRGHVVAISSDFPAGAALPFLWGRQARL